MDLRHGAHRSALVVLVGLLAGGCATAGGPERTPLPDFPRVEGEPSLYVAYPDSLQRIAVSDSNFLFGTTGTGNAELTVNGRPVEVEPNGAFLAFLPVPPPSAGDTAVYRLVARAGGRIDSVEHRILLPGVEERREGVWVDSASADGTERWLPPEGTVELAVRAAPGMEAWVELSLPARRPTPAPDDTAAAADTSREDRAPADAADPPGDTVPSAPDDSVGAEEGGPGARPGRVPLREASPGRYGVELTARELRRRARAAVAAPDTAPADTARRDTVGRDTVQAPPEAGAAGPPEPPAPEPPAATERASAGDSVAPDTLGLRYVVTDGRDTVAVEERMPLMVLDPRRLPVATLSEEPDPVHGEAGLVVGRPTPYGSYAWQLPLGSSAPVDRRAGDRLRLRLGPDLHAWVTAEDLRVGGPVALGPGEATPHASVGNVEVRGHGDRLRLRVPVGRRLPAAVRPAGSRALELTVHGGLGGTSRMDYGPADGLLRSLDWEQLPGPRWRLRIELSRRVWGWDLRWEDVGRPPASRGDAASRATEGMADDEDGAGAGKGPADDSARHAALPDPGRRGVLVLDVRRPPRPNADEPLRGIRVAVDPGHPPVGAEGPTGLQEAEANLAIARHLADMLREAGAEPVLVRSDTSALGLYERRRRARDAAAHVLVSIHNNALPDGLRPYGREGTSTYYFHPHARPLAAAIQRGMLATMGLRDLGLHWGNLALPREPWMPSVLTEGAFMMIPRHEAALRTDAFQAAYARGVMDGLRRFLRRVAPERGAEGAAGPGRDSRREREVSR